MSKLGIHVAGPAAWDRILKARPRLIVTHGDPVALRHAYDALDDRCLLVTGPRQLGLDWGAFWRHHARGDLDRALDLWWAAARPAVEAAPFAYWMSFAGTITPELAASYAAFEAARVERLAEAGARACVGNFNSALPRPGDTAWNDWLTTCRAAQAHGGLLGLEEFGALYLWTGYDSNEWTGHGFRAEHKFPAAYSHRAALALRVRVLVRDWLAPVGLGELPIVITACGLAASPTGDTITAALSVDGRPTGGWQTCLRTWRQRDGEQDGETFYLQQLRWYDAQLERDETILGAAVHGWGTHDTHDIAGAVADGLLKHIAAGPQPAEALYPADTGHAAIPSPPEPGTVTAPSHNAPAQPAPDAQWYFVRVAHPEIFDQLWQQAAADADAARALLTWREVGGAFVITVNDFTIWSDLYQYGQLLAQLQGATLDGGELDEPPQGILPGGPTGGATG